jgi:hypothetical protein
LQKIDENKTLVLATHYADISLKKEDMVVWRKGVMLASQLLTASFQLE